MVQQSQVTAGAVPLQSDDNISNVLTVHNWAGMVPVRLFCSSVRSLRLVRFPSSDGTAPVNRFAWRLSDCSSVS